MNRRLIALAAATALAAPHAPARAQDSGWSVDREAASPIDGRRTLLVSLKRGEMTINLGCSLSGAFVTVHFGGRALLPASRQMPGRYRVDQMRPVDVTWDASASESATVRGNDAKQIIGTLARGAVWHVRVGDEERSVDVRGLSAFETRLQEACEL